MRSLQREPFFLMDDVLSLSTCTQISADHVRLGTQKKQKKTRRYMYCYTEWTNISVRILLLVSDIYFYIIFILFVSFVNI